MPVALPVSLAAPWFGLIAIALALAAVTIAWLRPTALPRSARWLLLGGMICLVAAAGRPMWQRSRRGSLAVMVDLSPSTRGASFRDANAAALRLRELIGDTPFQWFGFAGRNRPLDPAGPWPEMVTDQTHFAPPADDAIVLFSDGRFDLPAASPPVYVVVDANLEDVDDASVLRLELHGQNLTAAIADSGPARIATLHGTRGATTEPVEAGNMVIARQLLPGAVSASVQLNPGDLWPENDALSVRVSPPLASEKWWIGGNAPDASWRVLAPGQLPDQADRYLAPAVIVLDDVAAAELGEVALDRLSQYVRDLGGSLLILGGEHAFATGGYAGTELEILSPLASSPPQPTTRWLLLADGSGSMAGDAGGGISLWQAATGAIVRLLPSLPPNDPVQVGQFSDVLRWWTQGKTARQAAAMELPPSGAAPHGPTNLEAAMHQIADESDAKLPTQLLVLTDCDTTFDQPRQLSRLLQKKEIHLDVLALGRGSALEIIRKMAVETGGTVAEQLDPKQWVQSVKKLAQTAMPQRLMQSPVTVDFVNGAATVSSGPAPVWNRTWLKNDAELWARQRGSDSPAPMAGCWPVGSGRVAATAFTAADQAQALARLIQQRPRDPRFSVHWDIARQVRVIVDAIDGEKILNDLPLSLESGGEEVKVTQTAPGRYEAAMPAARQPEIATLRVGDEVIDRRSLPGRYAPEFDAVGNDHPAMRLLAQRSGGAVIWPDQHGGIDFHWPKRQTALTPWLCGLGAILITAGLVRWRIL